MEVVPVTMPSEIRRRRDELVLRVQRVDDADADAVAVFAEASTRLRRLVPFDAAVWLTTVAVTISATAAARPNEPPISEVGSQGRAVAGGRSA
jgi:hypothetical protein